jgi:hypothetical protein
MEFVIGLALVVVVGFLVWKFAMSTKAKNKLKGKFTDFPDFG